MSKAVGQAHLHNTQLVSRCRVLSEVSAKVFGTWVFGTVHPLMGIVTLTHVI